MRGARAIATVVLVPLLALGLPAACTSTTGPVPTAVLLSTRPTGTLIVSWTVARSTSADSCRLASAAAVHIQLRTTAGADAGSYEQDCASFSTSIELEPETYAGTAILVDSADRPRTVPAPLTSFTIVGGDVLSTPIDFVVEPLTPN